MDLLFHFVICTSVLFGATFSDNLVPKDPLQPASEPDEETQANYLPRMHRLESQWDLQHNKAGLGLMQNHNEIDPDFVQNPKLKSSKSNEDDDDTSSFSGDEQTTVRIVTSQRASPVSTTQAQTTTTPRSKVVTPKDEVEALSDWVRELPSALFDMKNRMRLASIFLHARSKQAVVRKLIRAGGNTRSGRKRIAYHPLLRFAQYRVRKTP